MRRWRREPSQGNTHRMGTLSASVTRSMGGGGTPTTTNSAFWNGSIPWVSPKDMKTDRILDTEDHVTEAAVASSPAKLFPSKAVLVVTRSGILSRTLPIAVTEVPVTVNQDLKALVPAYSLDPYYLAHALRAQTYEILKQCSKDGTTVASIDTEKLLRFKLPIAPESEQRRVVDAIESFFTRLNDVVATLERVERTLKRYRASVLKSAVEGRLVPTEAALAKQEGRDYEPASVLLERILTERRLRWSESGKKGMYEEPTPPDTTNLPAIPEGWCWASAEQLSEFITKGTTPAAEDLSSDAGEVPFIKVYNLTFTGALDFSFQPTFISAHVHRGVLARSVVQPGDVLMNIVGPPLGKVSIVPAAFPEWNINQAVARYRPVLGLERTFLAVVLRSEPALDWVKRRAKATVGQFNLTLEICRQLPVPLPPSVEQCRIVASVSLAESACDKATTTVKTDLARCTRLRQSILKWAFEGKLADQDPNDEPASVLLERIKAERDTPQPAKKKSRA